jgi:hypothetical protein
MRKISKDDDMGKDIREQPAIFQTAGTSTQKWKKSLNRTRMNSFKKGTSEYSYEDTQKND